jgi:hypothetical protein
MDYRNKSGNDKNYDVNPTSKDGGRSRTRTYDPLIKSQLLYHLSYAPILIVELRTQANAGRVIGEEEQLVHPLC